jgi:hypothetical protein
MNHGAVLARNITEIMAVGTAAMYTRPIGRGLTLHLVYMFCHTPRAERYRVLCYSAP